MQKIIGSTTTYYGKEHQYLIGYMVRIVSVLKGAADPSLFADSEREPYPIDDDDALARAGGVTAEDRVEVRPWIAEMKRFSFVTSDPLAVELELFKHLNTRK